MTDANNIYLTIGDYNQWDRVQDLDNNFGKILKIDKKIYKIKSSLKAIEINKVCT